MSEETMPYFRRMQQIKLGLLPPEAVAKERKPLKKVSDKRKKENEEAKERGGDNEMDKFFERNRKKMVGLCQCGCSQKSQKNDDTFYRGCISHVFPKRIFKSIATNDLNWVERAMFGGCHSVMDDTSMDRWVNFADWEDIKERFHELAPLLTDEERATKFYTHLEKLIYQK